MTPPVLGGRPRSKPRDRGSRLAGGRSGPRPGRAAPFVVGLLVAGGPGRGAEAQDEVGAPAGPGRPEAAAGRSEASAGRAEAAASSAGRSEAAAGRSEASAGRAEAAAGRAEASSAGRSEASAGRAEATSAGRSEATAADRVEAAAFRRAELRLSAGLGVADPRAGTRAILVPRFDARIPLAPAWQLEASWALAALFSPQGVIEDRRTGETGRDDTPRVGNPYLAARWAALRAPSGFSVDATLGIALPMASIPTPTPPTGPAFERAPHTEELYRRALAVDGFRSPWLFLWNTGSAVATGYVRQVEGPVVLDVEAAGALLVPAGRLRAEVGAALGVSAYAGAHLAPPVELGMRIDMTWVSPQRSEIDRSLQIRGAQLALAPELRIVLGEALFVEASLPVNAAVEVEPRPADATWGLRLGLGAGL